MARDRGGVVLRQIQTLFGAGTVAGLTDGQLLERFATRDGAAAELAFAALVERHGPMVLRVCRRVLADPHDAQDAFQATFLVLVRRAGAVRNRESVASWLYGVAARVAACSRATTARRRAHEQAAARAGDAVQPGVEEDGADLGVVIREELGRLPDRYRDPVILCDLEGQTYEAAARLLGWPVGTIKSRLSRGRRRLRDRLTRRGLAPAVGALAAALAAETSAAEVPAALADSVAKAATRLAAGRPLAGIVSARILTLVIGGSKRMLLTKLKIGAALLASGCLLSAMGTRGPDATKAADPVPEAKPAEAKSPIDPAGSKTDRAAESVLFAPDTGLPSLLYFRADGSVPCQQMDQEIDRLSGKGYPLVIVEVDRTPILTKQLRVEAVPTLIVVAGVRSLARVEGFQTAIQIAAFYRKALDEQGGVKPGIVKADPDAPPRDAAPPPAPRVATNPERVAEPALAPQESIPKPWETVVRIKVQGPDSVAFGSGTIIRSTPEESTILTCAHTFLIEGGPQPSPARFPRKVSVDLFDGNLVGQQVHAIETVPGRVIDYDLGRDVGLLSIRPGRRLPASPVVPPGWEPKAGMVLTTVGCSLGNDATAWSTKVLRPDLAAVKDRAEREYSGILCQYAPQQGRTGGGLFTSDGYVAGVCNFAEPESDRGIYAAPGSIQRILHKNMMIDLGRPPGAPYPPALDPTPEPAQAGPSRPDLDGRMRDMERKLDRIIEALRVPRPPGD